MKTRLRPETQESVNRTHDAMTSAVNQLKNNSEHEMVLPIYSVALELNELYEELGETFLTSDELATFLM